MQTNEAESISDGAVITLSAANETAPAAMTGNYEAVRFNAMKHGISKDPAARLLRISAERDGTRLILTVYNDGPALPKDERTMGHGIGVQNTIARLQMLYGDEARLWLRDHLPHGVRAEIILPFRTNSSP